jgi:hypothetical protein
MITRLAFIAIAVFWVTMNVLLWRMEYSAQGNDSEVPAALVWQKILTAPDASSLSIYQDGERSGFCEFSTSVETEMAKFDADKPPPDNVAARSGYQIRINGNTSLGDFTNRLRFDARVSFSHRRQWRELNLKLSSRVASVEIHSIATNETVEVKIINDGLAVKRTIPFTDLHDPNALLREFAGNFAGGLLGALDLPALPEETAALARPVQWEAHRDHLKAGTEPVTVYRLETHALEYSVVVYVSTLGEILRIELPDGLVATLDEWTKP